MATLNYVCTMLTVGLLFFTGANAAPVDTYLQSFCADKADDVYAYIFNCSQFIQCSNNAAYLSTCAGWPLVTVYYNDVTKQCDWPENLTPAQVAACSQLPAVDKPLTDLIVVDAVVIGRAILSCPSGYTLTSCSFTNSQLRNSDPLREAVPINSTSCACSDAYGFRCIARCANFVLDFETVRTEMPGSSNPTSAWCSSGKKVFGCYIARDDPNAVADPAAGTLPVSDGDGCVCFDRNGGYCVAACASTSNINGYEIQPSSGSDWVNSGCSIENYVLGLTYASHADVDVPFHYSRIVTTSFQGAACYTPGADSLCVAICGRKSNA